MAGEQVLREGDKVRICEVELTFHSDMRPDFLGEESSAMVFEGSKFGVTMVDEAETSDQALSRVEVPQFDRWLPHYGYARSEVGGADEDQHEPGPRFGAGRSVA